MRVDGKPSAHFIIQMSSDSSRAIDLSALDDGSRSASRINWSKIIQRQRLVMFKNVEKSVGK